MNEICICAAIKTLEGKIIRGHRHDDCIQTAIKMRLSPLREAGSQGFMTSENRYVGREEAMRLQKAADVESMHGYRGSILFSEDLY